MGSVPNPSQRVILDFDLAAIYGVSTKRLNEQVRRNARRFPDDFMFQLTSGEWHDAIAWSSSGRARHNRSQIATGSQRHRDPRYAPYAFTEHGAIMAANVLRSERAIQMSVFVVRAFVRMRQMLAAQTDLAIRLAELEKMLTARLDTHESAIVDVLRQIMLLVNPPSESEPEPPVRKIGFHVREQAAKYEAGRPKRGKR